MKKLLECFEQIICSYARALIQCRQWEDVPYLIRIAHNHLVLAKEDTPLNAVSTACTIPHTRVLLGSETMIHFFFQALHTHALGFLRDRAGDASREKIFQNCTCSMNMDCRD